MVSSANDMCQTAFTCDPAYDFQSLLHLATQAAWCGVVTLVCWLTMVGTIEIPSIRYFVGEYRGGSVGFFLHGSETRAGHRLQCYGAVTRAYGHLDHSFGR